MEKLSLKKTPMKFQESKLQISPIVRTVVKNNFLSSLVKCKRENNWTHKCSPTSDIYKQFETERSILEYQRDV